MVIARKVSGVELSIWTAAFAVLVSLCVSYYPIEDTELKLNILIVLSITLSYTVFVNITDVLYNKRFLFLILVSVIFLISVYFHQIHNPPLTEYAETKLRNLVFSLLFFLLIVPSVFVKGDRDKFLLYAVLIFSLMFCVFSFFDSSTKENIRYSAIDLSPTMMAKITIIPCIFVLTFLRKGFFSKAILFAMFALASWATIRTGSRGPILCLIVAYVYFLYLKNGLKGFGKFAIYAPFMLLTFFVALYFMPEEIADRFLPDNLSIESNSDSGDRVFLWEIALNGIRYSWSGYGLGNFSAITFLAAPHNVLLEMAYEVGVAIALLYAVIIFSPFIGLSKAVVRNSQYTDFFVLLYLTNLILALISGEVTLTSALLYISTGYLWGLGRGVSPRPARRELPARYHHAGI